MRTVSPEHRRVRELSPESLSLALTQVSRSGKADMEDRIAELHCHALIRMTVSRAREWRARECLMAVWMAVACHRP